MSTIAELSVLVRADLTQLQAGLARVPELLAQAGAQATSASASFASAGDAGAVAMGRFAAQIGAAQSQIMRLNAEMMGGGRTSLQIVSDGDLAKIQAAQEQTLRVAEAKKIVAAAVREIEAAENKAAAAADKAAAAEVAAAEKAAAAAKAAAEAAATKATAANEKAAKSGGKFATELAGGFVKGAEAVTVIGAATAVFASKFDQQMMAVKHNTTLTDEEFKKLRAGVLAMGQESGLPFDGIAKGMMRMANEGYSVEQSLKMGRIAMEGARATNSDTEQTFNLLAQTMHTFKIPVDDASKAYNTLHVAANEGNMTVEDFVKSAGPALSMAAAFKMPLNDVAAAYSALTRNGFTAAQTNTLVRGTIAAIAHPSKQSQAAIEDLGRASGVDLVKDFAGVRNGTTTLTATMGDLFKATDGHASLIVSKLMPAMRGGMGAMVLAGKGQQDLNDIFTKTSQTMAGTLAPTHKQYEESMLLMTSRTEVLRNKIEAEFLPVGEKFAKLFLDMFPTIEKAANMLKTLLDVFTSFPAPIQSTVVALGALALANNALGGPFKMVVGWVQQAIAALVAYRAAAVAAQVAAGGAAATGGAAAAGGAAAGAGGGGLLAGLAVGAAAVVTAPVVATVGIATILAAAGKAIADQQQVGADADARMAGGNNEVVEMKIAQIARLHEQLRRDPGSPAILHRLKEVENYVRSITNTRDAVVKQGGALFETNPQAAGAAAASGVQSRTAGMSEEQIEAAMKASHERRTAMVKAQTDAENAVKAEAKKFTAELAAEQTKLTEAQDGGDKKAQAFAVHIEGLTDAHKRQVLAVHAQVEASNAAAKARDEQEKVEKKYGDAMVEADSRIRDAQAGELSGLEKLRKEYPNLSDERLKDLLAKQKEAAATEHLANKLTDLKQKLAAVTAEAGVHREAINTFNKTYEELNATQQKMISDSVHLDFAVKLAEGLESVNVQLKIASAEEGVHKTALEAVGVEYEKLDEDLQRRVQALDQAKKQLENLKVMTDLQTKMRAAQEKFGLTKGQGFDAEFIAAAGGVKVFNQLSLAQEKTARAEFAITKANDLASESFARGSKSVGLYGLAMDELQHKAKATQDQIQQTQQGLTDSAMDLAGQDKSLEDRRLSINPQQLARAQQLRSQITAEASRQTVGPREAADSQYKLSQLSRQYQGEIGEDTQKYMADVAKRDALKNSIAGTSESLIKMKKDLADNATEVKNFQIALSNSAAVMGSKEAKGGMMGMLDALVAKLSKLKDAFIEAGKAASLGLSGGLVSGSKDAQSAASGVSQAIISQINNDMQTHSPSKVMLGIGQNVGQGLANGIASTQMTVAAAMAGLGHTVINATKAAFQQNVSATFGREVAAAQKAADERAGLAAGGRAGFNDTDIMARGYYAQLAKDASRYDSLSAGGRQMNRSDTARNLHVTNHITVHGVQDPQGFAQAMSRSQIMQQMYEESQMAHSRNG